MFGLAFEAIGGGEEEAGNGMYRSGVARLFEPDERFVNPRLQQARAPDLQIQSEGLRIARAEAYCLLSE